MSEEKKFAEGIWLNDPSENAPDFVLGNIAILPAKFKAWMDNQPTDGKGYLKLTAMRGRNGKPYICVDSYERKPREEAQEEPKPSPYKPEPLPSADDPDGIPF
jgi:hypothetical protein